MSANVTQPLGLMVMTVRMTVVRAMGVDEVPAFRRRQVPLQPGDDIWQAAPIF